MRKGNIAITMDHTVQFVQRGLDNLKGEAKASVVKPYASPLIKVVVPASPFDNHYPFRIFYTQSKEGIVSFTSMTIKRGSILNRVGTKAGSTPQEVAAAILSVVSRGAGLRPKGDDLTHNASVTQKTAKNTRGETAMKIYTIILQERSQIQEECKDYIAGIYLDKHEALAAARQIAIQDSSWYINEYESNQSTIDQFNKTIWTSNADIGQDQHNHQVYKRYWPEGLPETQTYKTYSIYATRIVEEVCTKEVRATSLEQAQAMVKTLIDRNDNGLEWQFNTIVSSATEEIEDEG